MRFNSLLSLLLLTIAMTTHLPSAQAQAPTAESDSEFLARLEAIVQSELDRKSVCGVSIALIQGDQIVYAKGFGHSHVGSNVAASEHSIYRAGSISKLITAVAAMKLQEQQKIDLDAPVQHYLPEFRVINPYHDAPPVSLRRLMSHRSGMVRECPVGGYFDDQEPSLDETLASLADCVLPTAPDAKTRYSNAGPTIVGKAIEAVSGESFEEFVQKNVFDVVGMTSSSWKLKESQKNQMAMGYMSVAQVEGGFKNIEAPRFELGTVPAGNLYTTVEDLGRFVMFLVNEGRLNDTVLLQPETLAEMYRPSGSNATRTFGLGFALGKHRDYDTVLHMGAVYGFTSSLVAIPGEKVGAVVLANEDLAVGSVQRIMDAALDAALSFQKSATDDVKASDSQPVQQNVTQSRSIKPIDLKPFVGSYEADSYWAELTENNDELQLVVSGQTLKLEPKNDGEFIANGRFAFNSPVVFEKNEAGEVIAFTAMRQKFRRIDASKVPEAPELWKKFVGSYGPDFIPLIVSIRNGNLYAMTENEMDYRLIPMNRTVFKLPLGMYSDEHLVFQMNEEGTTYSVIMANIVLKRSDVIDTE